MFNDLISKWNCGFMAGVDKQVLNGTSTGSFMLKNQNLITHIIWQAYCNLMIAWKLNGCSLHQILHHWSLQKFSISNNIASTLKSQQDPFK